MISKIQKATELAFKTHEGQYRKGGNIPYVVHPLRVAWIVSIYSHNENVICAALLHDIVEDGLVTFKNIQAQFGKQTAQIVWEVTADSNGNFNIKSREALLVKLADTLDNISTTESEAYIIKKTN
jgi:myo-inositol-1(or 4)-monophosphatase